MISMTFGGDACAKAVKQQSKPSENTIRILFIVICFHD